LKPKTATRFSFSENPIDGQEVGVMYKRILLPLDGSDVAEQAMPHAVTQAQLCGAELILLRVLEPFIHVRGLSAADLARIREQSEEWASEYLDVVAKPLQEEGVTVLKAMTEGRPHAVILQYAEEHDVDLIVLCSRGRSGVSRWLMGSVADRVVRGATVPVLLVRTQKGDSEEIS
jgi:nucleotide-binding universal stress UspA family protein